MYFIANLSANWYTLYILWMSTEGSIIGNDGSNDSETNGDFNDSNSGLRIDSFSGLRIDSFSGLLIDSFSELLIDSFSGLLIDSFSGGVIGLLPISITDVTSGRVSCIFTFFFGTFLLVGFFDVIDFVDFVVVSCSIV